MAEKHKLVVLILSVLFFSALKYTIDSVLEALPIILQLVIYTALPIAGGLITFGLCSLLVAFTDAKISAAPHLLARISEDPARNFLVGFFTTAYLALIRPTLTAHLPSLPYMEWFTIALAVYAMYTMTGFSSKQFSASSEDLGWRRHIQEVKRMTGQELTRTISAMEQFVDDGMKELLLVYLTLHLQRLGETEEDILKTLSPLIDYQKNSSGSKRSFLSFPWTKRKLSVKNKRARENLLNTLLERIDRLGSE